jgi:hypothetical protein
LIETIKEDKYLYEQVKGKDSNLLSTKTIQIQINKNRLLRVNPRRRTPWEKKEDHQSNVVGAKKITYTKISLT